MDTKDLKHGEIYVYQSGSGYIVMFDKITNGVVWVKQYMNIKVSTYIRTGGTAGNGSEFREATQEEKAWLIACIAADGWVDKPLLVQEMLVFN